MLQQFIAIMIIAFFVSRLFWQRQKKDITGNEFLFWLVFWSLAGLAIVFIKSIDELVRKMGFSASGIEFLLYAGVAVLFYFIFRLRLRLERMDKKLTRVIRELSIREEKDREL
jgi:hypothetical protein